MEISNFKSMSGIPVFLLNGRHKVLVALVLLSAIFMSSCSKYEEGPGLSLRSKKARVVNNWKIAQAISDGKDVTSDYNKYELNLTDNYNATLSADYVFFGSTYTYITQGTWSFVDDKKMIACDFAEDSADGVYVILKLKENEMWVKKVDEDLELHFVTNTN
jgi:hypothetical protein